MANESRWGSPSQDARNSARLTHSQYNHVPCATCWAIRLTPANQFPPEDFINGIPESIERAEPFTAID